jgi:hypothetical protein
MQNCGILTARMDILRGTGRYRGGLVNPTLMTAVIRSLLIPVKLDKNAGLLLMTRTHREI